LWFESVRDNTLAKNQRYSMMKFNKTLDNCVNPDMAKIINLSF